MKNRFFKYTAVFAIIFLAGGCNDEFLERYPLDEISSETFWRTESDLINYNNSFYDQVKNDENHAILQSLGPGPGVYYHGGIWWNEQYSDNLAPTHSRSQDFYEIRTGNHRIENSPRSQGYRGFELVRSINFGLANYDRAAVPQAVANRYKGEARLFRGWFYADKVSKFGEVQWIESVLNINSEELYGTRDKRDFVMDKVLEDLNFAVANLPANWGNGQNPGRVTKWVALAVKSRVCLFEGTWRKYHGLANANKWLTESMNASKELIDNGGFRVYSTAKPAEDYRFALSSTTQVGNPEVIYWRKYEPLTNGHFASRLFWNYNGGTTKSFVDDVLSKDGLPISLSPLYKGDANIENTFIDQAPRLRQSVLHPADQAMLNYANDPLNTYPRLVGMAGGRNLSNTGYHVIKHWNAADEAVATHNQSVSPPVLRLGEVLLNYAEAKAELGTITQADLNLSINKLRDRVAMAHLTLTPPLDPRNANDGVSALIVEIRRERRVELFMEGFRYDDLRRWKQGKKLESPDLGIRWDAAARTRYPRANRQTTTINGVPYIDVRKGTPFDNAKFDETKHYLWPLPISVLAQNPNFGQNPGWK